MVTRMRILTSSPLVNVKTSSQLIGSELCCIVRIHWILQQSDMDVLFMEVSLWLNAWIILMYPTTGSEEDHCDVSIDWEGGMFWWYTW